MRLSGRGYANWIQTLVFLAEMLNNLTSNEIVIEMSLPNRAGYFNPHRRNRKRGTNYDVSNACDAERIGIRNH